MSPYAKKKEIKTEWRCHDALSNSLVICYLVCTVGNHPLSRDVALCTCGCLANWGGAPKHDLENEGTTNACVHSAVQSPTATQCICVDVRSCNCHDTLQHRSLLLRRHDWKNFHVRCSHKPVQCSRTMTGETTSTIVECFAVPFAPTPTGLEMFLGR